MRSIKYFFVFIIFFAGIFFYIYNLYDVDPDEILKIDGSRALYDRENNLFHVKLSKNSEWQIPIKLNQMGKWLPLIAVNAEDGRFYKHNGIDFLALSRAVYQNLTSLKIISGASTITSQVIRLAVSERENLKRTPLIKLREFISAMKLEKVLTKSQILELYLNLAPFGGNIRGVQAASYVYFGKPASKISPGEACLLIGMLKGPTIFRPDKNPINAKTRRDEIINLMLRKKIFTEAEAKRAKLETLPNKKFSPPMMAWHYSEMVLNSNPELKIINTELKLNVQSKLEAILKNSHSDIPENITFSAGIVENKTASLIAWVGNSRFNLNLNSKNNFSWVDCGNSPRSPGSSLKPFAYLSAVESGLITPSSLIADTSLAFSGRAPRNFDLKYRGAVSARVALSESLNAPAVRILRMTGQDKILNFLHDFGFKHLDKPAKYYGDSLVLGGCEVTLLEELEAYCALANLGIYRPLKFLRDQNNFPVRISDEASCWIINDMLNYRGELTLFARGASGGKWQISLKTGTSYGFRDAWCAVWNPEYTVIVWAGNPEGKSWPGLIGAKTSAPVAIKIMRSISNGSKWFNKPENLILREVCSLSGRPPVASCPDVKKEYAIKNITRTTPCEMHIKKSGVSVVKLPSSFDPENSKLNIISPVSNSKYFIAPFDLKRNIPFRAEGANNYVFWYLDGKFIGRTFRNGVLFYKVSDGEHYANILDSDGTSANIKFYVTTPGKKLRENLLF